MKPSSANMPGTRGSSTAETGRRRIVVLMVVFLLGAALTGAWFKYGTHSAGGSTGLSDQTLNLLHHLNSPVEIRFYSILPPDSAPELLRDFSRRVDRLLSEFQAANDGKIHVVRNLSTSGANADAAAADGIRAFNLDKGDACFLGITVAGAGRKATLAQLQPEWEPALPFDLARAILQVTATQPSAVVKASRPVSSETTNEILRLIPDVKGTSLEDGTRILRGAAVQDLTAAGTEAEEQLNLAKQQLADARNSGSEQQQQAAAKHLQDVQFAQAEKVKAIAARLEAELAVFQQMKAAAPPADAK